jgi:GNAT superfamily N-acetyltransferase
MSFWEKSPGPNAKHYIKSIFSAPHEPRLLTNTNASPPAQSNIRRAILEDIPKLIVFWQSHFRRPHSPICQYEDEDLRSQIESGAIILLKEEQGKIIGTIMSRSLGNIKRLGISSTWSSFRIRWIDMFCVHHNHWHKGIGSQLLHQLYKEHEAIGDYACYFLKEGSPLHMPALRSSFYLFRHADPKSDADIEEWTSQQFVTYAESLPPQKTNIFIHSSTITRQTKIFHYKGFRGSLIAAFHKCPEKHYEDYKPIIWCTGVLKFGELMDSEVDQAMLKLSDAASLHFNSPWIWVDGKHLIHWQKHWQIDGAFHLYAYHMDTGIYFNGDPFLIL